MNRKLSVGLVVVALLGSGLRVGVSRGTSGDAADPMVIELVNGELLAEATYRLRDDAGRRSATIDLFKGLLADVDGNEVGVHRCQCINSEIGWMCTHILNVKPGPYTQRGSVVITGNFRGFAGERLAVTGGTGAYADVNGYATATVDGENFVTTLYLRS